MARFDGRSVIVTGAGSGFGAATARRFAAEGAGVLVADVDGDAATRIAAKCGANATARTVDVRDAGAVEAMIAAAEERFGGLDVLVNNAGLSHVSGPVELLEESEFQRIMDVNVKGVFLGVKYGVPALRRRGGGVILVTSSIGAVAPRPGVTVYNASKGAVLTMTRGLAGELAPQIRVNAVLPVAADTAFMLGALGPDGLPERNRAALIRGIPMGRLCEPDDVAAALTFLASDDARFITGVCLPVDGGRSIS